MTTIANAKIDPLANDRSIVAELTGDVDQFRRERWKTLPAEHDGATPTSFSLSTDDVWEELDCGLVVYPFVRTVPASDVFQKRIIVNNARRGYAVPELARRAVSGGASLVLEQAELWNTQLLNAVNSLRAELGCDVSATIVLSSSMAEPRSIRSTIAAKEGEQIFVIQMQGTAEYTVSSAVALGADDAIGTATVGRTVYLPADADYVFSAAAESLIVVFRAIEPSDKEIAETILAMFLQERASSIAGTHHLLSLPDKLNWFRRELKDFIGSISVRELESVLHEG